MTIDDEFVQKLSDFALSEKEARVYFQLLKYGPQPAAVLAKRLKGHREDVHRTLRHLSQKGMIRQSLSKPTVHAAIPIQDALDAVLRQEAIGFQHKEEAKHDLIRLAPRLSPHPSEEFCTYRVVTGCKECIAASLEQAEAAKHDILTIGHSAALGYSYKKGYFNTFLDAVERGVQMRFILDIQPHALDAVRAAIEGGVDVRHYEQYHGIMFTLVDLTESFTVVTFDVHHGPKDTEHTSFLCDNPQYARGLAHLFELVWNGSIDGARRIRDLANEAASFSSDRHFGKTTL